MFNAIFLNLFNKQIEKIELDKIEYNKKLKTCCLAIKNILTKHKSIKYEEEYIQLLLEKTYYIEQIRNLNKKYQQIIKNNIFNKSYAEQFSKLPNIISKYKIANEFLYNIKLKDINQLNIKIVDIEITYMFPDMSKKIIHHQFYYNLDLKKLIPSSFKLSEMVAFINLNSNCNLNGYDQYRIENDNKGWGCIVNNKYILKYNILDLLEIIFDDYLQTIIPKE